MTRLSEFIISHMDDILSDWEDFARSIPAAREMDPTELRDHARQMLEMIAHDMEQHQSADQQEQKSLGHQPDAADTSAKEHGAARELSGFTMSDMVSEYRALRATVIRQWSRHMKLADLDTLHQLTRFNEAIDQAVAESTARFMERIDHAREIFLGVLGHDLRNPLSAVLNSAGYLMRSEGLSGAQTKSVNTIYTSGCRLQKMVEDLLDVARTRLGQSLPMEPHAMDLAPVCAEIASEIQAFNPERVVRCSTSGDLSGEWDAGRLGQLLSNLLGNAIQHGDRHKPVTLTARSLGDEIEVQVHNEGPPIEGDDLDRIFQPLVRTRGSRPGPHHGASLGLGLFIAREIAQVHGGRIGVESSQAAGTIFTVVLPRTTVNTSGGHSSGRRSAVAAAR